ncbi:MAG: 1,4-alpha-glucan branching protein GlgB [bacterium]
MNRVPESVLEAIARGRFGDPGAVLGPHRAASGDGHVVRVFLPGVVEAAVLANGERVPLEWLHADGVLAAEIGGLGDVPDYRIRWRSEDGPEQTIDDPYRFVPSLRAADFADFAAGRDFRAYERLGAHAMRQGGVDGVRFAVWAPNATRAAVVGDFNDWNARRHPMRPIGAGVWELFLPGVAAGAHYKYEFRTPVGGRKSMKADPFAFASEGSRGTASVVAGAPAHAWEDEKWMKSRAARQAADRPLAAYEVHVGSWRRAAGKWKTWRELAKELIPHAKWLGFTHLELLPVMEHPFDGSWGYQVTGFFAPTARFGAPDDLRAFVDAAHRADLGVILDWVPGHFPRDAHGLAFFDGTHLYEPADPRVGYHPDWHTFEFDYSRPEVRSFLYSSATYWIERYHADGLRVDAVASMLYLDYSRKPGEWVPNEKGGRENLHAVELLKELNDGLHERFPGVLTCAEESTSWPGVTRPVREGGLGFDLKWNLGWMNDWLAFLRLPAERRSKWFTKLTFGLTYAFEEKFLLPLSHDEVVHGKRSLLNKMPGGEPERFANLRVLYGCMMALPGRKLLFMGSELAPEAEWNHDDELPWRRLTEGRPAELGAYLAELLRTYREEPALHACEDSWDGFEWIDADDAARCVLSFVRKSGERSVLVIANLSPRRWTGMRFGVAPGTTWERILSSEEPRFGGGGDLPAERLEAEAVPAHGREASVGVDVAGLSVTWWRAGSPR